MYSDRKEKKVPGWLPAVLAVAAALLIWLFASSFSSGDMTDEGASAIREAVRRTALQCYAVEGIYPPTLEYMQDNYGLEVNTRDYYIRYDIFASNVAPEITVTGK